MDQELLLVVYVMTHWVLTLVKRVLQESIGILLRLGEWSTIMG